jgi:hypothetical protein
VKHKECACTSTWPESTERDNNMNFTLSDFLMMIMIRNMIFEKNGFLPARRGEKMSKKD